MSIRIKHVTKHFGQQQVIDNLSLEIDAGQLVTLLGPSGCGKTTLLRIIAGLEQADRGQVLFHGKDSSLFDFKERAVGFVFQNYALFRHMTVANNISFGLRMRPKRERLSKTGIEDKIQKLLQLVQLEGLGGRYPHQLSGGQSQRVALARALAIEPQILLLDEPFGALDAKVRKDLRSWLRGLQQKLGITCILVTHDQEEALEISDQVVLLNQGKIEQEGTPEELFENPASLFALQFLGQSQAYSSGNGAKNQFIRPHEIRLHRIESRLAGHRATIENVALRGATARIQLKTKGEGEGLQSLITTEVGREFLESIGLKVGDDVIWTAKKIHSFPVAQDFV